MVRGAGLAVVSLCRPLNPTELGAKELRKQLRYVILFRTNEFHP